MSGRGPRLADVAHELRSPLNAIRTWAHVLESQLRDASPEVQRALDGIRIGIDDQVRVIDALERAGENSAGPDAVPTASPPRGAAAMSKRKDAQPEVSGTEKQQPNPQKPEANKPEMPGEERADKGRADAVNKTTRRGER
jgi:hypothetical protein